MSRLDKSEYQELLSLGVEAGAARYFMDFKLPFFRKPLRRQGRQWPHIEVGGDCLRIGKTTTKQVLVEQIGNRGLPFVFSDEDWKANIYLADSYRGSAASLLKSQKWFAKKKRAQLAQITETSLWIQVVHPEMDWGYAMTNFLMGNLSKKQWLSYWQFYRSLKWEEIPAPDLLVYITAQPNTLVKRFNKTARDFEKADDTYIRLMQVVNQKWLNMAQKEWPILLVNTDHFDYSYQTGAAQERDRLGEMLFAKLSQEGWKL